MSCLLNLVPQFMSWLVNITPQFVNWLLDEDLEKWDEHWMPVSLRCRWNRKIMISMKIIRTTYLWFRQIKIKVPWAPFWNVLILVYGHCPAIYQILPLGSKSSIFDQIWSIYLIWRFHFYLKYKEKRAALDLFCKECHPPTPPPSTQCR